MKTKTKISLSQLRSAFSIIGIAVLLMHGSLSYAQITITQSGMPVPGDTLRKSIALNTAPFDFAETGAGYTWEFAGLLPSSQTIDTFVMVTETPVIYWPFFLLSANLASPLGSSPIEQIPLDDLYNFYNNSNNRYTDVGFAATALGIPLPFKFDQPDVLYEFPVNYGNVDSSQSGLQFEIPGQAYLMIDRQRVNTVDGWGTLRTPYGTFEVLRIRSEVVEYDSIYIDSLGVGFPVNLAYTEYKWMSSDGKIPLLKATESLLGTVAEYRDSIRDLTVGVRESSLAEKSSMFLFPNPVYDMLNVRFFNDDTGMKQMIIFGMHGRQYLSLDIKSRELGWQTISINPRENGLVPGKYVVQLKSAKSVQTALFVFDR